MESQVGLFPGLLGAAFEQLPAPVRELHRGGGGSWQGTASVTRAKGWLASLACRVAGLPPDMHDAPLRFESRADAKQEVWTRWFGDAPVMASRLRSDGRHLVEHLGLARVRFALQAVKGSLHWEAVGLKVLGIALPRRAFDLRARIDGMGGQYQFLIEVKVAGLGALIRYEGTLGMEG
jgi:hypothetical protein